MTLITTEGKHPPEISKRPFPTRKLNTLLSQLISSESNNFVSILKYHEYLQHDDVLFYTWNHMLSLAAVSSPSHLYIANYLKLLDKMNVKRSEESSCLVPFSEITNFIHG